MKKGKTIGIIVLSLFLIALSFGLSEKIKNSESYQEGANVDIIFDASQYSYISKDSLIEKLGEPTGVYDDIYTYDQMEFTVKNDIVTKFKYYPNEPVSYKNQDDIFYMFGITPDKNTIKKTLDNNSTYKFQSVANDVWEFEIYGMNEKEKTFDMVFISYQQSIN